MINSGLFTKQPLLVLQIVGWSTYLMLDWFDHFAKGHYLLLPSFICSATAFVLTGTSAYLTNKAEKYSSKIQILIFSLTIIPSTIVWHKIWVIMHGDAETDAETYAELFQQFAALADYSVSQWLSTGYYPLFLFLAWSGFFIGSKSYLANQEQMQLLNKAQIKAKQAQIQTLRYQLNPHFLFNVLNNIDVSVLNDDKRNAHRMIQHLSSFLRNSLQQGEQDKITLNEEISVIKDFVSIEQVRYGEALSVTVSIDAECESAMLPPMLLQPLVENAIKFAWSQTEHGQIKIEVNKELQFLAINITNSKAVIKSEKAGTGIGLKNTQERLALVYGDDALLTTIDEANQFKVDIKLPWEVTMS